MVKRSRNKKQEAISLIKRKENVFLSTFYNDDYRYFSFDSITL